MKPSAANAARKSVAEDAQQVLRAIELIELGARMQVLESELALPRERMIRLYHELKGKAPPRGLLPSSADWYMTWLANIHSSLFYNAYLFLREDAGEPHIDALTKGYRLYVEHCQTTGAEVLLDLTRAWTLVRFFGADIVQMAPCSRCNGKFVAYQYDLCKGMVCGACCPPPRAGKTIKPSAARAAESESAHAA
ncbi:flagellar transcriptional regulator FlhC [Trinickia terrae]|uniref:Flagellar transcriptional regulator FlhC n=1 Tax=Trinickia terrae TaxID=2571161 RepID=A0A4U1I184_9BURK|nr:flagellar transcriptional regulator FlhC [Trinickia terrae]TKC86902.1 flagellar transcriptional regulator FlhC [Trinickia terrae]